MWHSQGTRSNSARIVTAPCQIQGKLAMQRELSRTAQRQCIGRYCRDADFMGMLKLAH